MQSVTEDDALVSYVLLPAHLGRQGRALWQHLSSVQEMLQVISEADWLQANGPRMNPSSWWGEFDCGDFPSTKDQETRHYLKVSSQKSPR